MLVWPEPDITGIYTSASLLELREATESWVQILDAASESIILISNRALEDASRSMVELCSTNSLAGSLSCFILSVWANTLAVASFRGNVKCKTGSAVEASTSTVHTNCARISARGTDTILWVIAWRAARNTSSIIFDSKTASAHSVDKRSTSWALNLTNSVN